MCGIIGFSGDKDAVPVLLAGLQALSYRGYDSAGISLSGLNINTIKSHGRISNLEEKVLSSPITDNGCGIGHTRWATHGSPSDVNAHPHSTELLSLVHNGIIENYADLGSFLKEHGYTFKSETDSEIAACLMDYYYRIYLDPACAIFRAVEDIRGSYAFTILFKDKPGQIYAIRHDSPLIAARTEHGVYIASDLTAIVDSAKDYYRPDDGILIILNNSEISFIDNNMNNVDVPLKAVEWNAEQAQRGGYEHFMLKEINEEPDVLYQTVSTCLRNGLPYFEAAQLQKDFLQNITRIHIVACGSAMHAGLVGKSVMEKLSGVPVDVEIASEFRYREPILNENELVILISQSGETADTLAALRYAKQRGIKTLSVVNVIGSTIAGESDSVIYTCAGPEIAVASTKAYMVQCAVLYILAAHMGLIHHKIEESYAREFCAKMQNEMPKAVAAAIAMEEEIEDCAKDIYNASNLFYIGRCADASVCAEGSLKLKEISYIHSEAFAAGEMKHGTISLVTEETPIIALLTVPEVCEKTISGIREVTARHANVLAICSANTDKNFTVHCKRKIVLPEIDDLFSIFPAVTIMQLLAYHASVLRGNDVDKPRHLAKSVTVE